MPGRRSRTRWSIIVRAPADRSAARIRHPDAVAIEAAVQVATATMLLQEGSEVGEQGLVHFPFGPRGSTVSGRQSER
jgi:hypothetical protein